MYEQGLSFETIGWQATCDCGAKPKPCVVLDPFGGSGTVGFVSAQLGRDSILIELNPKFREEAERRIKAAGGFFVK